jgi:GDP/UDP-N,N'-diacetylbacillosamine 2-epimerase (hydrolysing)
MKEIQSDEDLTLQIIATGMHFSPEFGLTYKTIEGDGFVIDKRIEIILSSDTSIGISKSMGLALISFSEAFAELSPDVVVVLGDRYEIFSAVQAAMIANIPIAHIHGGESTEGVIDEAIRHSITKMAHIHFTSTLDYKNRVIQLGEQPSSVHNVGAIGMDNIKKTKFLSRKEFEERIQFKLNKKNLLITFHPVTLEASSAQRQFQELLDALDTLEDTHFIFTYPNSDTNGRVIIELIHKYVVQNKCRAVSFASMGQLNYLSALRHVDAVVGNSSSGIVEAPLFNIATINIGDRQKGRVQASSVLNCKPQKNDIIKQLEKMYFFDFQTSLKNVKSPYYQENVSINIKNCIKQMRFESILKKKFYDIK